MNIGCKQVKSGILVNCFHDLNISIAKTVTNCYIGRVGGEGICIKEGAMMWIVCLETTQQIGVIAFAP